MANGEDSGGGRLTFGQRVHKLEHDQAQTRKEVKKVKAAAGLGAGDDELVSWVGKEVTLVPAVAGREPDTGILKRVRKYTLLVEVEGALEVYNKGQVLKVRLAG